MATADQLKLNIGIIAVGELGHFIPVLHIGRELAARGHKVTMITNAYGKAKNMEKLATENGCDMRFSEDDLTFDTAKPEEKNVKGKLEVAKMFGSILKDISADICVVDFFTSFVLDVIRDELKIPAVINVPGPLLSIAIMNI